MHFTLRSVFLLGFGLCLLFSRSANGRPVDKRDLSSIKDLKDSAIRYVKSLPARWREFIPDDVYEYGVKKAKEMRDKLEYFFEGDIAGVDKSGSNKTNVLAHSSPEDATFLWQGGIVPYDISSSFAPHEVEVIQGSLDDMMAKTCIKFVKHGAEADYISFVRRGMGCSSYVARQGGRQYVDLQPGCIYEFGEVQHEIMHALGFYHEQSRQDRDDYVTINFENVKPDQADQFKKYVSNTQGLPYDYNSIMHYGWNYFAIDITKPTILAKIKGTSMGNRKEMSSVDIQKINKMYSCPERHEFKIPGPWAATTAPPGVAPAGSQSGSKTTRCPTIFSRDTTTQAPGFWSSLKSKAKDAVKSKVESVVCSYVS